MILLGILVIKKLLIKLGILGGLGGDFRWFFI